MAYTTIDDPSAHFQATTYTGTNSSSNAITNSGNSDLQPDMVWIKVRTYDNPHTIQDTSRGFAGSGEVNVLQPASTASEVTNGAFESFDSNGFTVGGTNPTSRAYNGSTDNYIAWQWKANGGTTSSNTSGTITSTVQADTTAGFSIVSWAGNAQNATIGHGLGATPKVIISKALGTTNDWNVYHRDLDATAPYNYLLNLHNENTRSAATGSWGTSLSDINSTTFYKKYWINYNTNMIAYCFAEKQGYSKFGKYKGNTNADGAFVYTGFKPAFVLIKKIDVSNDSWVILDTARNSYNGMDARLFPDLTNAESTSQVLIDSLSNGFKLRTADTAYNGSGVTYIYMAFAENPFVTSTGIPTTAR